MATDRTQASLELLYHISRELAGSLDLRAVLQRILALSLANVGAERGSIIVLDERGRPVDAAIVIGTRITEHSTLQLKETVERGLAGWVVKNNQPALVPDTSLDNRWLRRPDDDRSRSGAKSAICVPLLAREHLAGVLTVVHPVPGFFKEEHLVLIQAIADLAGMAVLNARLYDDSQRQARVMTALAECAISVNASLRLDEVLQRILEQAARALQTPEVLLALVDEARQELAYNAATGDYAPRVIGYRQPIGHSIGARVAHEGRGLIVNHVHPTGADQLPGLMIESMVVAPVQAHGKVTGILEIVNPPRESLNEEALFVLTGIGNLAGVAIDNARLFERLEETNRRYRDLFEDSTDPILISDFTGKVIEANRQAGQISGYASRELERLVITQLVDLDANKISPDLNSLPEHGPVAFESLLHRPGGRDALPVEVHVHRVRLAQGECLQWILRDMAARKELALLQDQLIAMVYHDLRSPLANVISSLDLVNNMLPSERDPAVNATLSIADRSTKRMQRLVDSLLDIHRLEAGQSPLKTEQCSPWILARDAQEMVQPAAESKEQQISLALDDRLPAVRVDEDMIRRVLINLLENATKYAPIGGHIQVGGASDGRWVKLWVEDDGPGIPESEHGHIFDKYTRLTEHLSVKGLGLGLAFCKLAVQAHGGRIWIENRALSGSRFVFTLPLAGIRPGLKL